jgi:hypothetical protein
VSEHELISDDDKSAHALAELRRRLDHSQELADDALARALERMAAAEARAKEAEERAARAEALLADAGAENVAGSELESVLAKIEDAERRRDAADARTREILGALDDDDTDALQRLLEAGAADARASVPIVGDNSGEVKHLSRDPKATAAGPAPDPSRPALNDANYEQLREAGLDVTEVGHLLAARERSHGFGALAEVAQVQGLSGHGLEQIERSFRI